MAAIGLAKPWVPADWSVGARLGVGAYSVVHEATRLADDCVFAVKIIDRARLSAKEERNLSLEVKHLLALPPHPSIVRVDGFFADGAAAAAAADEEGGGGGGGGSGSGSSGGGGSGGGSGSGSGSGGGGGHYYLVTELLRGGELVDKLIELVFYEEAEAKQVVYQVLGAVACCHAQHLVHRDLKVCPPARPSVCLSVRPPVCALARSLARFFLPSFLPSFLVLLLRVDHPSCSLFVPPFFYLLTHARATTRSSTCWVCIGTCCSPRTSFWRARGTTRM